MKHASEEITSLIGQVSNKFPKKEKVVEFSCGTAGTPLSCCAYLSLSVSATALLTKAPVEL